MQTETLELNLNRSQIVDQVAALLYATSIIPDNVDILNIQFSDLFGKSDKELCKLTISTRKELNWDQMFTYDINNDILSYWILL